MRLIEIDPVAAAKRATSYCERLEDGQILWLRTQLLEISESDRRFLCDVRQTKSSSVKNISYDSSTGILRGYDGSRGDTLRLKRLLGESSHSICQFVMELLAPYAQHLEADLLSFRPLEEEQRVLPTNLRNDLIHIDAFPSRPARGRRILRFFMNLHLSKPRVWLASESFETLANRMALDAGLAQHASSVNGLLDRIKHVLLAARSRGHAAANRTPYDRFMLHFHDYLKRNASFQANCPKERLEFPAGSAWIAFTDAIPHAVVSGRCALEQTFFLPFTSMLSPHKSPLRILEAIAGSALV